MGKKRVFAALLALAVTVGSLVLPARAAFTDTTGHWAETAITKWSEEYSIINGYEDGTFRPDNSITRGAFAGILDRFLKFQSTSPALAGDTITRQQAVTMIARAFNISGESATVYYLDADQVADYAKPYLAEMSALGYITDSSDGYFRPTDAITRAEIVTILDNMIEVLIQTSTTYTQDVEGTVMVNAGLPPGHDHHGGSDSGPRRHRDGDPGERDHPGRGTELRQRRGHGPLPAAGGAGAAAGHPARRRVHALGDHRGVSDIQQPTDPHLRRGGAEPLLPGRFHVGPGPSGPPDLYR